MRPRKGLGRAQGTQSWGHLTPASCLAALGDVLRFTVGHVMPVAQRDAQMGDRSRGDGGAGSRSMEGARAWGWASGGSDVSAPGGAAPSSLFPLLRSPQSRPELRAVPRASLWA